LTFSYPTSLAGNDPKAKAKSNGQANGHSNGSHPVLQNIDLKIPAGSTLAIVGPTGSGKTTLAALIARLWKRHRRVISGRKALKEWPLAALRSSIGFVPQDTYLFGETIGGNIAFGLPAFTDEQVLEAAGIANLDGDIQDFPKRYETVVGERGITLSGGQKQRTAIARAVIRDPRILILDDALSSVDTQTEERILTGLKRIMEGRTTILISHRTSTVRDADQIVVLVTERFGTRHAR
jgi:ATP-binding cassette subfamily B protein